MSSSSSAPHKESKEVKGALVPHAGTTKEGSAVTVYSAKHLEKAGRQVREAKERRDTLASEASDLVKRETAAERAAVEAAVEAYNAKVKAAMRAPAVVALQRKAQAAEDEVEDTIEQIAGAYRQAVRAIRRNAELSDEQQHEQIGQLERAINEAIVTDRERNVMRAVEAQIAAFFGNSNGNGGGGASSSSKSARRLIGM